VRRSYRWYKEWQIERKDKTRWILGARNEACNAFKAKVEDVWYLLEFRREVVHSRAGVAHPVHTGAMGENESEHDQARI
jgi:hypothetical protein